MTGDGRFAMPPEVLEARRTALEHARTWREQAGVLRRRAARPGVSEAERAEAHRRAAWHEARAQVLTETLPRVLLPSPLYPRELATPLDRLRVVDELRHALAEVRTFAAALEPSDLDAFVRALVRDRGGPVTTIALEALEQLEAHACTLAEALGAAREPFTEYRLPIVAAEAALEHEDP